MTARLRIWLNSMQAHMIGFAFGVIAIMTAMSVVFVVIAGPPQRSPMTIYDVSRVVRGLPPAQADLAAEFTRSVSTEARLPPSEAERHLSRVLAKNMKLPSEAVRVNLGNRSAGYFDYVERQAALYDQDGGASPILSGTVEAAVRRADGTWEIYERRSKTGLADYWNLLRASPWLGFLILIPLSMLFSAWLSRPVRVFAQAAGQVGGGKEYPVPVAGPTEIRVAAKALNEMQARIRAFVRERTALVGAIAHDLRTPLNSLRFRIARAPDDVRVPAEEDIKQLDRLIGSILDYVESGGRRLSVDTIDLTSMLQSLVDDLEDQGFAIEFEALPVNIQGDLLLLRRMFANLIDNAVKYGSRVAISLRTVADQVRVEIADDGPGLSQPDLAKAFEPFFRGEPSRNRATGGIGLGLAIARSVAEAHGGQIILSNAAGGGLVASVSLPFRQQA